MNQRDLRTSDAERMSAAQKLQTAMSEGFLTLDEFDERTSQMLSSRTRGELADLTTDLPPRLRFDPNYDIAATAPTSAASEPVVLEHSLDTVKHGEGWSPPPHMIVKAWGGTAILDFAAADLTLRQYRVTVDLKGSSARFYLPDGCGLQLSGSLSGNSGLKDKRRVMTHDPSQPMFLIDGTMTWTTLKLMGPRRGWWDA